VNRAEICTSRGVYRKPLELTLVGTPNVVGWNAALLLSAPVLEKI
jgi:hypothetical protein